MGFDDFEAYYSNQLIKDAFEPPRQINEKELYPKRKIIESSLYHAMPWAKEAKDNNEDPNV